MASRQGNDGVPPSVVWRRRLAVADVASASRRR
jgi:hypothetical protein